MREHFPSVEPDDAIQETLVAVCRVMPSYRYDPDAKGHFRNYLTGILRNKARRTLRDGRRRGEIAAAADGLLNGERASARQEWQAEEQAWRESVFETALAQLLADPSVADRTKRIFERTAINGEPPESVAAAFKMTRHAVDQAKSRAMGRLREIVKGLESAGDV